jgi:hypothetical protein
MVKGEPKSDVIEPSAIAATPKTKGL